MLYCGLNEVHFILLILRSSFYQNNAQSMLHNDLGPFPLVKRMVVCAYVTVVLQRQT